MNNVEKLNSIGILGAIRQRLGGLDETDEGSDLRINGMSNSRLISLWSGWHLGDEGWWNNMKAMFDDLEEIDKLNNVEPSQSL